MEPSQAMFVKTKRHQLLVEKAGGFVEPFRQRAAKYDKDGLFPTENFHDLKRCGLTTLTVPEAYGGEEISLYEFLLVQETIARGDGATALSLGWHNGIMMQLRDTNKWSQAAFENLAREVVHDKLLINSAATEPSTGSPARGGKPETSAVKQTDGWLINGKKTFTSLAPALDRIIITATITTDGKEEVGEFLLNRGTTGIRFEKTWDTLGMRSTRSDDLILDNVHVPEDAFVATKDTGHGRSPQGWLLHIPACYIGIALAARDNAIAFAKTYQPNSLSYPISEVPEVRRKTAEMDLELMKGRHFMYHVASVWDEFPERRPELGAELAAVKTVCTNAAVAVVDLAMRIVGGHSLQKTNALERYYRDIRAGLHNPPSDDITTMILANNAYQK